MRNDYMASEHSQEVPYNNQNYAIPGNSMASSSSSSRPVSAPSTGRSATGTGARGKALWKKVRASVQESTTSNDTGRSRPDSPNRKRDSMRDLIAFEEHIAIVEAEEAERSQRRDLADS